MSRCLLLETSCLMLATALINSDSVTADQWRMSAEHERNSVIEYCNGETFEPRCHGSDVIVMLGALYGRMKLGRCVKRDPGFESMLQDPLYLGCSANVLDIVSRVCSGQRECSLRVLDQNFHNLQPCYDSLKMHLEAAYTCFNVAAETRYCMVSVSSGPQHIIDFGRTRQHSETLGSRCGDQSRPWTIDALNGQRIVVSLIDLTAPNTNVTSVGESDGERCYVTYGDVIDKVARKNISICRGQDGQGLSHRVYVSQSNSLHIVFNTPATASTQQHQHNFIINVEAVGCSDLVSPSDGAWLRRDGDEVVVGCYTSRQSWQLRCVDGVWTGTVGLCPQHHYHSDTDQLQSSHSNTNYGLDAEHTESDSANYADSNFAMLSIVAVSCCGVALCLIIVCVGVGCLRRQNRQVKREKSAVDVERFQPLNGDIDSHWVNVTTTNDDVNLHWHQQQRQQLVI